MLAGQNARTVLVSVHHGRPVAASMLSVLEELGGLGLVAIVRPCPDGFDVVLTPEGVAEARRQWSVAWWMRWRDAAARIENRRACCIPSRLAASARARRARERARAAFERFAEVRDVG